MASMEAIRAPQDRSKHWARRPLCEQHNKSTIQLRHIHSTRSLQKPNLGLGMRSSGIVCFLVSILCAWENREQSTQLRRSFKAAGQRNVQWERGMHVYFLLAKIAPKQVSENSRRRNFSGVPSLPSLPAVVCVSLVSRIKPVHFFLAQLQLACSYRQPLSAASHVS